MDRDDAAPGTRAVAPAAAEDPAKRLLARKVAILVARNKSTPEIAAELSISEDRVKTLKKSPLFMEMVSLIEEKIIETGVGEVVRELLEDASTNFRWIKGVRDGTVVDNAKDLTVRLKAAGMLWDRQIPNQKDNNAEERTVSLVISAGLMQQMARGMRNDGQVIEAEFEELLPAAPPIVPMTSDEFIQRYIVEQAEKARQEDEE